MPIDKSNKLINNQKEVKNVKTVSIFSAGILIGLSALLFAGVVQKNGFPQSSHAQLLPLAPKKTIPFICTSSCAFDANLGNRLSGKDLTDGYFVGFNTAGTNFSNTNFMDAYMGNNARFNSSDFSGANFTNAFLSPNDSFSQSNFTNAKFTGANMQNCGTDNSDFTGANFTNANLSGCTSTGNTFTNATWSNTTCADGTNSNNNGNTCIGHLNGQ